jgi:hypothetical protein
LGLQYKIIYKKGPENKAVDALSRVTRQEEEVAALSTTVPRWLKTIAEVYLQDKSSKDLLTELSVSGSNAQGYTLSDGIIRYKGRIWLGANTEAHQAILLALHPNGIGGHSGITATYHKVKQLFSWPNMKEDIRRYMNSCEVCLQAKIEHNKYLGLPQPFPPPPSSWHIISLDFIKGLPKSKHATTMLVIIDKFSKYAHFLPLAHPYTAASVAQLFMDNVYKLHGMPQCIISDRYSVFTSTLWKELFKLADTTLNMSSNYHPQTDGQTERLNQSLESYLWCMIQAYPHKWVSWLSLAEFWYNTTYHSALGKTPFEVLYGYPPRHFGITADTHCQVPELEAWLQDRAAMHQIIKHNLERAQNRMKIQADKHRSDRSFVVGDWVYVKLEPYVQMIVARRSNHKLSYKYFGPYPIVQKVGEVAYKLQLPPSSQIHPVIHVSQLKKALPPATEVSVDDELAFLYIDVAMCPVEITARKTSKQGSRLIPRVEVS